MRAYLTSIKSLVKRIVVIMHRLILTPDCSVMSIPSFNEVTSGREPL